MLTREQFEECLRRADLWVREQQAHATREGVPLSQREQEIAVEAGVRDVERVRLMPVAAMPAPDDPLLRDAMEATGFWLHSSAGLTLGHAIFLLQELPQSPSSTCSEQWRDEELIAHELVHVAQVERLGLQEFLRLYLEQCLSVGYPNAPLEREARAFRPRAFRPRACL